MEILNTTTSHATSSGRIVLDKGIQGLIFYSDKFVNDLTDEEIKITIESPRGNRILTPEGEVNLKKFLLLLTYGTMAITGNADFKTAVSFDLCRGGFIPLGQGESLVIEFTKLKADIVYIFDTMEGFAPSNRIITFDDLSIDSEKKSTVFPSSPYDMMVLGLDANIKEVSFRHDNGVVIRHTLRELGAISQTADPVAYMSGTGNAYSRFTGLLQFPLIGIQEIEVIKTPGTLVNFFFRRGV